MKRFVSLTLALAMLLSLTVVTVSASSLTEGDICTADGSEVDEILDTVAPGQTIYVAICERNNEDKVEKIRIEADDSESKALIANSSKVPIATLKYGGERWYFAKLTVRTISADDYDEDDDYYYEGELEITYEESDDDVISLSFDVKYDEQDAYHGTFYSYPTFFTYKRDDEIDISDEDSNITLEGKASGTGKVIASVDTDTIDALEDKYGEKANMDYYTCSGKFTRIKNAVLTIEADGSRYLYQYSNGKLTNLSDCYDKDDDCFYIEGSGSTFTLGTYVVSDAKLSGSVTSSSSQASSSSQQPTNPTVPQNPATGAAA